MASGRMKWPRRIPQFEGHNAQLGPDRKREVSSHVSQQADNVLQLALDDKVLNLLDGLADSAGTTTADLLRNWIEGWLCGEVSEEHSDDIMEAELIKSIRAHQVVFLSKLDDPEGTERTVEPHLLYETRNGDQRISVYQTDGYSESGELPGWRNITLDDIRYVAILDRTFEPRWSEGYNPDSKRYPKVLHQA